MVHMPVARSARMLPISNTELPGSSHAPSSCMACMPHGALATNTQVPRNWHEKYMQSLQNNGLAAELYWVMENTHTQNTHVAYSERCDRSFETCLRATWNWMHTCGQIPARSIWNTDRCVPTAGNCGQQKLSHLTCSEGLPRKVWQGFDLREPLPSVVNTICVLFVFC